MRQKSIDPMRECIDNMSGSIRRQVQCSTQPVKQAASLTGQPDRRQKLRGASSHNLLNGRRNCSMADLSSRSRQLPDFHFGYWMRPAATGQSLPSGHRQSISSNSMTKLISAPMAIFVIFQTLAATTTEIDIFNHALHLDERGGYFFWVSNP